MTGTDECQETEWRLNFDQVQVTFQCCLGIYRPYLVSLVQPYIIHHQKYSPTLINVAVSLVQKILYLRRLSIKYYSDCEEMAFGV